MQPSNVNVRGYSDFFASGFRAVTNRSTPVRASFDMNTKPSPSSTSSRRQSLSDITQRRARPSSMIISRNDSKSPATYESKSATKKGRRSSFISFSSRLFDRITSVRGDENMFSSKRSSRSSRNGDESFWVSTAPNGSSALHHPIDPFASSPDTRSMFIDLSSSSSGSSPSDTPKHESFLSLTGSSVSPSNRSSLILSRRERPTSIQTMPLPSRSRRSSWQYRAPSQDKEKSDFFLILEEEPGLEGLESSGYEDNEDQWDAPAKIDWHQFHIDILTDDA
ncbi:hypothetical protein D9613_008135 [Agrocybe pediades]|uniref:Uncharacterized protein n=1 Tax=Agrocybe pediades TaxID=84607 RepID=A0A8H4VMN4_9AGAR|nr:hypothetical protein D9613_008135 [Agrocybe pediades]